MNDLKKLGLVLTAIGIAILASMRLADFLEKRIELSGHGEYPVHRAMDPFEDISYLRTLIGLNADLNELDAEGLTALHLGIGYSQDAQTVEKIILLPEYGADPNIPNAQGLSPYEYNLLAGRWALKVDYEEDIEARNELDAALKNAGAKETIISLALTDQWDELRKRIAKDPNIVKEDLFVGNTLLHLSVAFAEDSFFEFLIDSGADVNAGNRFQGLTPLLAYFVPIHDEVDYLLKICGAVPTRQRAAPDRLVRLVEAGADPTLNLVDGMTLTHTAALYATNSAEMQTAAQLGDINALDQDGRSPLAYALENENRIAVDWLLENGATVNPIDIEFAMVRNNFELLHRLLDATTDLNALDRSGRTMLFYALRNKNQIAVDWLLEHKATPVPRDFNFAMYRNDLVLLQTMLDINTDLNVPDQGGRTPLTYLVDSMGWRAPNDPENPSPQELENLEYAKRRFDFSWTREQTRSPMRFSTIPLGRSPWTKSVPLPPNLHRGLHQKSRLSRTFGSLDSTCWIWTMTA